MRLLTPLFGALGALQLLALVCPAMAGDERIHAASGILTDTDRTDISSIEGHIEGPTPTPACADAWAATSTANAPAGRESHTAIWTGSEMIVWGGFFGNYFDTGGRYNPVSDSWTATSTTNGPAARGFHTAVWTGSEMIVWGGSAPALGDMNTGARYNPGADSWAATSTTNAPTGRATHTAVWTGSEMIVWGGYDSSSVSDTGGRYDPSTDSWTATSTTDAPSARQVHTAIWTGSEMIVWGGGDINSSTILNTGARYNPSTNSWTATSTTNAPTARSGHTAIWTGSEMIIWGGGSNTGGRYNPGTDSWTATSTTNAPTSRATHTAVWTGSEMIVWGGYETGNFFNTGGRYNPSTDTWTATSTTDAPSARTQHKAVWTDSEMIVWSGFSFVSIVNTGGRYCAQPSTTPTPSPAPSTPTPTPSSTPAVSPTATATPTPTPNAIPTTTFGNISTRLRVEAGDNVLIGGFIVTGTQPKKVIVRAIGPSLLFTGTLADPILELRDSSGSLIRSNDNWRSDQEAEIIATTIPPSNDLESALVEMLPANGSAYTAIVRGVDDGTGAGLVEVYDLDRTVDSKLANISTRGLVQTGDDAMIAGTIVLGQASQRVLVRAIGPSLQVGGKLADPTLELRNGNGTLIRANDNWRSDQEAEIIATGIPPTNDLESAIIETLPANGAAYTAIARGVNNTTGVALVEVYALN